MTTKTEADKAKTAEDTRAEKPIPSQVKVDAAREEAVPETAEAPAKAKKATAADEQPYPSQEDLDRIKAGTFRSRETKAAPSGANYQTR